jgi:hypothetical protein
MVLYFFEKLIVAQPVMNFPVFKEYEALLPYSKKFANLNNCHNNVIIRYHSFNS